jgi:hypothetical protein
MAVAGRGVRGLCQPSGGPLGLADPVRLHWTDISGRIVCVGVISTSRQ